MTSYIFNKEAFFLRHTACLPAVLFSWSSSTTSSASTSGGSTSVFTSGGSTSVFTSGGVYFCVHFWGSLPCSLLGVSTSLFTSGVLCDLSHNALTYHYRMPQCIMGKVHMGHPHFHVHFLGVPCDLSHNALIYHYRTPQCIMGKIHMAPPESLTDWLTDKHDWKHYFPADYVCGR